MGDLAHRSTDLATLLDDQGMPARVIADQLGHARPSMTQDFYMGRKAVRTAEHLENLCVPESVPEDKASRR